MTAGLWRTWRADVVAGASIAGLLLPEAVAYSGISGMPPQAGVIGLLCGLLIYGFVGRSRFAVVSATSSSAAVLAAATASMAEGDMAMRLALAAGLVLCTGIGFVIAGVGRLGELASFISKPVLRGFAFGLAAIIALKQFGKMVGAGHHGDFLPFLGEVIQAIPHWNMWGLATGLSALILLRLASGFKRLPGPLLVIALGIGAGHLLALPTYGVALVGNIDLTLASPSLPQLSSEQWLRISELAAALLLILFAESYSAIRSYALKHGDAVSPNRDMVALGLSNIASALFQGTPVGAGFSATSASEAAGTQSTRAAWAALAVVVVLIAACLPWIERTPEPVLAAIVIHAISHGLGLKVFRPYFGWKRDRLVIVAAVSGVLVLGVLHGLLAAIAVSLFMALRDLAAPRLSVLGCINHGHEYAPVGNNFAAVESAGVKVIRPEVPLFFANVDRILDSVRRLVSESKEVRVLILSLEETPDLDGTCIEAIDSLVGDLKRAGVSVILARVKERATEVLTAARLDGLGEGALDANSVADAVARAERL